MDTLIVLRKPLKLPKKDAKCARLKASTSPVPFEADPAESVCEEPEGSKISFVKLYNEVCASRGQSPHCPVAECVRSAGDQPEPCFHTARPQLMFELDYVNN